MASSFRVRKLTHTYFVTSSSLWTLLMEVRVNLPSLTTEHITRPLSGVVDQKCTENKKLNNSHDDNLPSAWIAIAVTMVTSFCSLTSSSASSLSFNYLLCGLDFYCQLDTTESHLEREGPTWRTASIRLACGKVCERLSQSMVNAGG